MVADWRRKCRANQALEKETREGTLDLDLGVVRNNWLEYGVVCEDLCNAAELCDDQCDRGYEVLHPYMILDIKCRHGDVLVPL